MKAPVDREVEISSLPGFDTVADILKQKSFAGCTMVRQFALRNLKEDGNFRCDLTLDFVHDYDDTVTVRFEFEGVHGLKIGETHQVSGLAFKDVTSRGWDRTRYEVYDYENDAIRFFCHRVKLSRLKE